jgi:hypothetical protein
MRSIHLPQTTLGRVLCVGLVVSGCQRHGAFANGALGVPVNADRPLGSAAASAPPTCIPRATPRGITVLDAKGRTLNARGVHLTDWDGFLANPAVTLTLRPPADARFPATATLRANQPRIYFDLPSTVDATGPTKRVTFATAESTAAVRLGIFPDRDGADEHYELTLVLSGEGSRTETLPITVHDQDRNRALLTRVIVDFDEDRTAFFGSDLARSIVQRAADDWSYFLDDLALDPVAAGDESTWVFDPDGFQTGRAVSNASGFAGFLLHAYGFHTNALRSGGEGSYEGKPATSRHAVLPLRRSGGLEVETQGNYNSLGWTMDLDPDHWWVSANQGDEKNDLYSIVHHEIGHAHAFNPAYPRFAEAKKGGLTSTRLDAYYGRALDIDSTDHFDGAVDPASGFGAFGNEYNGPMPARRWVPTRLDVLALEAVGYRLRPMSFDVWDDEVPDCP